MPTCTLNTTYSSQCRLSRPSKGVFRGGPRGPCPPPNGPTATNNGYQNAPKFSISRNKIPQPLPRPHRSTIEEFLWFNRRLCLCTGPILIKTLIITVLPMLLCQYRYTFKFRSKAHKNAPKCSIPRHKIPKFSGDELYVPSPLPRLQYTRDAGRRVGPLQSKILRTPLRDIGLANIHAMHQGPNSQTCLKIILRSSVNRAPGLRIYQEDTCKKQLVVK